MDNDQLKKGQELKERIENFENQLDKYEKSTGFYSVEFTTQENPLVSRYQDVRNVNEYWLNIDFDIFKTIAIKRINEELEKARNEFKNL